MIPKLDSDKENKPRTLNRNKSNNFGHRYHKVRIKSFLNIILRDRLLRKINISFFKDRNCRKKIN